MVSGAEGFRIQTKGKHATLLNIIPGRVDVAVLHRLEAQIVTAVIFIVLAAALFSCQSVFSTKPFQPCAAWLLRQAGHLSIGSSDCLNFSRGANLALRITK
jgi:hypothetical protein